MAAIIRYKVEKSNYISSIIKNIDKNINANALRHLLLKSSKFIQYYSLSKTASRNTLTL